MARTIKISAIQMDSNPAPTADRLGRADKLVMQAAQAGAQLVVLPELFNTGYAYADKNFSLAESMDGATVQWLKNTAQRLNIHLAGSLMLLDQDEVYNALLLFAPNGQGWRYDKNYPWGWERGYFRDGNRITVAETTLGRIGMMICWDTGHPELWRRYAGRIDLMMIASCPPDISNPIYQFPNGDKITLEDLGTLGAQMKDGGEFTFGQMINQQTAWLGVPAVNTVSAGQITTDIPNGWLSLLSISPNAPWVIKHLPQANKMKLSCGFVRGCKVVDATGTVLTELSQADGESFTTAEVTLADSCPIPQRPQPPSPLPKILYFLSDYFLPWTVIPLYRAGLRRAWGKSMAPYDSATRRWTKLLAIGIIISFLVL